MSNSFKTFQKALSGLRLAVEAEYYELVSPDASTKLIMDMLQTAQEQFQSLDSAFSSQRGIPSLTLEEAMRATLDELQGTLTAVESMMKQAPVPDAETPLKACRKAASGIERALSPLRN